METSGTLVHGRLDPVDGSPDWTLTWSNAGHPPPLMRTSRWPGDPAGRTRRTAAPLARAV
ncbi:hypothetical protein ACFY0N_38810 [Streptomyces vinaceus]|uniref:hypothetical protein n=1 Tax=Streptomyces vinaceus TaxID=1960 RepID=UPI0035DABA72